MTAILKTKIQVKQRQKQDKEMIWRDVGYPVVVALDFSLVPSHPLIVDLVTGQGTTKNERRDDSTTKRSRLDPRWHRSIQHPSNHGKRNEKNALIIANMPQFILPRAHENNSFVRYLVLETVAPNPGLFPNLLTVFPFCSLRTRLPFSTRALLGWKSVVHSASRGFPEKFACPMTVSGESKS